MPHGVVPGELGSVFHPFFKTPQRKHFCRGKIADAVFVMDGQRLARFACDLSRARGQVEQSAPAGGGVLILPRPAQQDGERPQALDLDRRRRGSIRRRNRQLHRLLKRVPCATVQAASRVQAAERDRFAPVACLPRSADDEIEQPGGDGRERQQVEAVVFDDGRERPCVAGPYELKVPSWNLEAGHVADASHAEKVLLQGDQRATRLAV
jgi:hypothetical protein